MTFNKVIFKHVFNKVIVDILTPSLFDKVAKWHPDKVSFNKETPHFYYPLIISIFQSCLKYLKIFQQIFLFYLVWQLHMHLFLSKMCLILVFDIWLSFYFDYLKKVYFSFLAIFRHPNSLFSLSFIRNHLTTMEIWLRKYYFRIVAFF
jgi:hypothetical protein